jgi:hypothetical protein
VSDRWKYAYFETGHELLFDLVDDPYEQKNLATQDPETCLRMRHVLLEALSATREPYFDVLIEHGTAPEKFVINVSDRWRGGIAPTWKDMIHTPDALT